MDFPSSKYSWTDGRRKPGGTELVASGWFLSLGYSSPKSFSSGEGGGGALGLLLLVVLSDPSENDKILLNRL